MIPANVFERILVGVDADGLASHALVRALQLARTLEAHVDVVHAVELPDHGPFHEPAARADEAATLARAREHVVGHVALACREVGYAEREPGDLVRVTPGHAPRVLIEAAEQLGADLVVLGTHARRSMLDFGSTTRAVLARTQTPLWVQREKVSAVRSVLAPIDGSEHSRRALGFADALAARVGASVRVLHCIPSAVAEASALAGDARALARRRVQEWLADFAWRTSGATIDVVVGQAREAIRSASEEADLVVLGTHGRTGLSRTLLGSVAYGVLAEAHRPALVVPDAERTWLLGG